MNSGGGVFGALIFVIGVLALFAVMFGFFLIVPFFVFLAGIAWTLIADRNRGSDNGGSSSAEPAKSETVEVVETTTEVREVKS